MKFLIVFFIALILGYFLYPKFNLPVGTVIYRTEKHTPFTTVETRGHVVENIPDVSTVHKNLKVEVDVYQENTTLTTPTIMADKILDKKLTVVEKNSYQQN